MTESYQQTSSVMTVTSRQIREAKKIIRREQKEIGTRGDLKISIDGTDIWFQGCDANAIDTLEIIAKALIEELEVDDPFFVSWSISSDLMRVDAFSGGAMCVSRGRETIRINTMDCIIAQYQKICESENLIDKWKLERSIEQ